MSQVIIMEDYLECEKYHVFLLLIFVAGFYGAYTLTVRGHVFSNAQTANLVLFGIAIADNNFSKAASIFSSMTAYVIGTMLSDRLAWLFHKIHFLRWDTLLIGIDIIIITILGLLPSYTSDIIYTSSIGFMCAMQFNTFRQSEGIPMSTTFVTNHVRQTGSYFVRWLRKREEKTYLIRFLKHLGMIITFITGVIVSTILGHLFKSSAILFANIILIILFIDLLRADLIKEKDRHYQIPQGH